MPDAKPAEEAAAGKSAQRADPYRSYNFTLQFGGGQNEGYFTGCSGLGVRITPIKYREGGDGRTVHQLAGPVEYSEVTLKYGLTDSRVLWDWLMASVTGVPVRKNVTIIMQGPDGVGERMRWDLIDSWPSEWRGAPLDSMAKDIAIETLTLVYENLVRG